MHAILLAFLALGLFGLLTSTIYSGLVLISLRRHLAPTCNACAAGRRALAGEPPVSILKPLHGAEPNLEAHLEGFFEQRYPEYEILFCARTASDAGLQIARRVAARHADVRARFLTSGEPQYANAKLASLAVMAKAAQHELLIVSDSDVCVGPDYLSAVVEPFADPTVGAVTCLYRGAVLQTEGSRVNQLWAVLEGVGMTIEMTAGVLVANWMEGMQFLLGPTMAMRRECVAAIGGFDSLGQYCSDDFLLGNRIAKQGYEVVLSRHVIDHVILNDGFKASMKHQTRWMKSTRFSRPKGHFGTALTFSVPFALITAAALSLLGYGAGAAAALAFGVGMRMLLAGVLGRSVMRDPHLVRTMLLYPLRDLMGFGFWLASYTSNRILWRGETFELLEDGLMRPLRGTAAKVGKEHEPALTT